MALGLGLGGVQAKYAQLHTVLSLQDKVVTEGQLAVIGDVGGQDGELSGIRQLGQILIAIVELVVAGGRHIVADHVHQFDGGQALGGAHGGLALAEVTGIHQIHGSASGLVQGLQGGDLGIALNCAMGVVGVEDDDCAVRLRRYLERSSGSSRRTVRLLSRQGGDGRAKGHDHRQQEGEELVPLSHMVFLLNFVLSGLSYGGQPAMEKEDILFPPVTALIIAYLSPFG